MSKNSHKENKTSTKILDKIHKEQIKPTPKWHFILGHIILFVVFGITILLGSIAVSVALFRVFTVDWAITPRLPGGPLIFIPYLWLGFLAIMIFIGSKLYSKMEEGYKHHLWVIATASIVMSLVIGSVLFAAKVGSGMENFMRQQLKPYQALQELRDKAFHAPENGVLPGRLVDVKRDVMILMDDFNGIRWEVDIVEARMPMNSLDEGMVIIAIGEKTSENEFKADAIKPGEALKGRFNKPPRNGLQK